jgi:hypothetical protein
MTAGEIALPFRMSTIACSAAQPMTSGEISLPFKGRVGVGMGL